MKSELIYPKRKIREGATVFSGYAFKSYDLGLYGIPVIKIKNVNNRTVTLSEVEYFSHDKVTENIKKFFLENNDVLIAMTGQGSVGRVGKLRLSGNQKILLNQRVGKFITKPDSLDNEFLYQVISSPDYEQILFDTGSGSGQPNLSPDSILDVKIPFPDIDDQRKIAKILSHLDDRVWFLQRLNEILDKIIQSIFKSWFINFDGQIEFVDSELGQIPKGWEVKPVGDVCEIFSGGTPSTKKEEYWNGTIPWFSSGETRNDFIIDTEKKITQEGVDNSSTRLARKGDVLIASAGQGNTRGQVSLCLIDTYINQSVLALRSKDKLNSTYLFCNLRVRYDEFRNVSDSYSSRGSLPKNLMTSLEIIVPKENILKLFDNITSKFIEEIETNMKLITKLNKIRDSLLPKLMSGEIRV